MDNPRGPLIVSAGEASGDLFAAHVVRHLPWTVAGLGGPELEAAGADLWVHARDLGVMGFGSALRSLPHVFRTYRTLTRRAARERPTVALLVGFSEFNARFGRYLRRSLGARVLWYSPPQIWAWRPGRATKLAESADVFATILPFEAPHWQSVGARIQYVGHPCFGAATEVTDRAAGEPVQIALLPGSRRAEVTRLFEPMLETLQRLTLPGPFLATLVLASGLSPGLRSAMRQKARDVGVRVVDWHAGVLHGFDVALVCSGTATAECVAARVPPVTVFRTDVLSYAVARRLVRVPHVALPNLVLGERAFPEWIQDDFTPEHAAASITDILARPKHYEQKVAAAHARFAFGTETAGSRVAALLMDLAHGSQERSPETARAGVVQTGASALSPAARIKA